MRVPPFAAPCAIALALLCGLLVSAASAAAKPGPRPPSAPALTLGPGLTAGGVTVTLPPAGLSIEYPVMAAQLGSAACPPPALTAELQRLGSPPLQLAGQSQDFTVPGQSSSSLPPNWESLTSYPLAPEFWTRLHCLLSAAPSPLTVGLNVRKGQLAWAEQMASAARASATAGLTFSLGNEPDLYYLPNFASLTKPQPNEEASAASLYLQAAGYIRPAAAGAPLAGPELSTPQHWRASLPRVLSTLGLQVLGVHMYPLSVCRTPRAATVSGLLSEGVGAAPRRLAWAVADATAAHAAPVITEANSVSCGGKAGVSDTPAAAVWALRFVLSALKTGFREVRFHFSGNPYDPFYLRGGEIVRRPLEGAMVALNQWLPVGARLRSVPLRGLTATAIATAHGRSVLILDNESAKAVSVVLAGYAGRGMKSFAARGAPPRLVPVKGSASRVRATIPSEDVLAVSF
ncbi:MAG: hypothetical protein ACYDC2_00070 [Solirubrobacteraceae bacterium]